jgi:hypothetical protein
LSALWKDVFLYHWKEESQHTILDELEWIREDRGLSASERDTAVNELIELVVAVDSILQAQSSHDANYFVSHTRRDFTTDEIEQIQQTF